jgi:hypothetical protein
MRGYDAVGVSLITAWVCYQTQSIISINQIGLAIWGWALSGCLIGYDQYLAQVGNAEQKPIGSISKRATKAQNVDAKATLYIGAFGLLGFLVALPPLAADVSLRTAQVSRDAAKLESTMDSSYFNPLNSQKFILTRPRNLSTFLDKRKNVGFSLHTRGQICHARGAEFYPGGTDQRPGQI